MDQKIENIIEKLKRDMQYKKSLAIRKTHVEDEREYTEKNTIVLKVGNALHDELMKDAERLNVSRQNVIETILKRHYKLLQRRN